MISRLCCVSEDLLSVFDAFFYQFPFCISLYIFSFLVYLINLYCGRTCANIANMYNLSDHEHLLTSVFIWIWLMWVHFITTYLLRSKAFFRFSNFSVFFTFFYVHLILKNFSVSILVRNFISRLYFVVWHAILEKFLE